MSQRCSIPQLVPGSGSRGSRLFPQANTPGLPGEAAPHSSRRSQRCSPSRLQRRSFARRPRDAGPIHRLTIPLTSPPAIAGTHPSVVPPWRAGEGRRPGPGSRDGGGSAGTPRSGRGTTGLPAAAKSLQHVCGRGRGAGPPANSRSPPAAAGRAGTPGLAGRGCGAAAPPGGGRAAEGRAGAAPPGRTADSRTHLPDRGSPQLQGRRSPGTSGWGVRGAASLAPPGSLGGRAERSRRRRGGDKGGWMAGGRVCGGGLW